MLIQFFYTLRKYQVKTTLRELLDLLSALEKHVVYADIEAFYSLSRTIMVKDETQYDKFDRAFAEYFEGVESVFHNFTNNFDRRIIRPIILSLRIKPHSVVKVVQ